MCDLPPSPRVFDNSYHKASHVMHHYPGFRRDEVMYLRQEVRVHIGATMYVLASLLVEPVPAVDVRGSGPIYQIHVGAASEP